MYVGLRVKYFLFLSDLNDRLIVSEIFRKILKYQVSWKSIQWESRCSMQKGRTGSRVEANGLISQFCERFYKEEGVSIYHLRTDRYPFYLKTQFVPRSKHLPYPL
jgi:hypothetical protein